MISESIGWSSLMSLVSMVMSDQRENWNYDEKIAQLTADAITDGGIHGILLEDFLYWQDSRLRWVNTTCEFLNDLQEAGDYKLEHLLWKPIKNKTHTSGGVGLSLSNLASMLIFFERLGFNVDPCPLVSVVTTSIGSRKLITRSELRCLWYRRERQKMPDVMLVANPPSDAGFISKTVKTLSGYEAGWYVNGNKAVLCVQPPKRIRVPKAKELA